MTYEEFKNIIIEKMQHLLPPDASIHIQTIIKNNGLKLDGLTISDSGSNISPTIFLNYYFEKQAYFPDFNAICKDILLTYEHNKTSEYLDVSFFTDYNIVKDHLAYRLINYEKNKELLSTVPHVRYLDLAIVFYCLLSISKKGHATILIHKNHLKLWKISAAELYQLTCFTTPRILPYDFRNMTSLFSELFGETSLSKQDAANAKTLFCPMYILTNIQKLFGACCMLYPHLLEHISDKLRSDLFILPSSIHELIILPAADRSHFEELSDMVEEINRSELSPDEILSSRVYYYSRSEQALSICS